MKLARWWSSPHSLRSPADWVARASFASGLMWRGKMRVRRFSLPDPQREQVVAGWLIHLAIAQVAILPGTTPRFCGVDGNLLCGRMSFIEPKLFTTPRLLRAIAASNVAAKKANKKASVLPYSWCSMIFNLFLLLFKDFLLPIHFGSKNINCKPKV